MILHTIPATQYQHIHNPTVVVQYVTNKDTLPHRGSGRIKLINGKYVIV